MSTHTHTHTPISMFLLPRATTSCSLIINAYHLAFNQPVVAAATVATAASALSHNSHHSSTQRNKQQAAMTVASSDCIEAAAGACNPTAATAAGKADGVDGVSSRSAPPYNDAAALDAHVERAWAHYRRLGSPKWMVAPMVDQVSELRGEQPRNRNSSSAGETTNSYECLCC